MGVAVCLPDLHLLVSVAEETCGGQVRQAGKQGMAPNLSAPTFHDCSSSFWGRIAVVYLFSEKW